MRSRTWRGVEGWAGRGLRRGRIQPASALCLALALSAPAAQQTQASAAGPQTVVLANDRVELQVGLRGGRLLRFVLRDGEPLNPMAAMGHFIALDGFGAPSPEEAAAGMPGHGETNRQTMQVIASRDAGPLRSLTLRATLPLAQETLTRTMELVEGEQVVYVSSELESSLGIDRPVSWAEHATLGPPFLAAGKTVIDMPATHCRVRARKAGSTGKLAYLADFRWPMAPLSGGGTVNLLTVPDGEPSLDLAACLMDPDRAQGYVTAHRTDQRLVFGYVFRREDFPWMMNWMNYSGDARAARGIEFSTQPFDVSHRETVDAHQMFGTPTYKWLPAKSRLLTRFLLFYTRVPEDFAGVADVRVEGGQIRITDRSGRQIALAAGRGL